jgi:hypothetical protein
MDKLWWSNNSTTISSEATSGDADRDTIIGLPLRSVGGHYCRPQPVTGAIAPVLAASRRDGLHRAHPARHVAQGPPLRSQKLSRTLGGAFFDRDATAEGAFFVSARGSGGTWFLEDGLYVCLELLPL